MLPSLLFLLLIALSNGVPLESPSEDVSRFFPRIVGGEDAPEGSAPYMAAVVISETFKMFVCGGSIISSWHLLTAAHCIDMFVIDDELIPTYHTIVGSNHWYKGIEVRIAKFDIHPEWDPQPIKNDIGILTTKKELTLNKRVAVIAISYDWIGGGERGHATGWGRLATWGMIPSKLQLLYLEILAHKQCIRILKDTPWIVFPIVDEKVEICAFHSVGHGMCNGDSGSALVHTKSRKLIGVTSWAFACARGVPDFFVRMSSFKDFVDPILEEKKA